MPLNMRSTFHRRQTGHVETPVEMKPPQSTIVTDAVVCNADHEAGDGIASRVPDALPVSEDRVSGDVQRGIQNVEAVTLTWSKTTLIAAFFNIWLLYFVNAMQSSILSNLIAYATSDFSSHSLLTVIYLVSDTMTAAVYIPLSKILDVVGRGEGLGIMVVFATLGLVLLAGSDGITSFCAAYVFYNIGFSGMTYCVDFITADATKLKNRALAYAFTSSPYIITAFAGPKAAEGFYEDISWRWAFGAFAIIFPFVAAFLSLILKYNLRKAKREETVKRDDSRTSTQRAWRYFLDFDIVGVLLFSIGLVVFFIPFDIAADQLDGWSTGWIIAMIVVGFIMVFVFAIWEWKFAPSPMLSLRYMTDRTVVGTCLLYTTYQISYYCWAYYFTSFLQAVNDLTIAEAGYISHTFDVVGGVLLLLVGFVIRKTGRFKWLLYIAVPIYIFAQGLMIYFRRPNQPVGYLVMCQVFIAIRGSVFILVEQLAILAAVDHQHIASALAVLNVVGTLGGAIGSTICGAIWTNTFRPALMRYLPSSALADVDSIYEDLETQLSYGIGTPDRLAIQEAYGYAHTRMLTAGCAIMALSLSWTLLFRNIDLKKHPHNKGVVF
ncbi:putative MFS siderophore iron transporter [Xylariomycetidae sp. FL2044]|nr:putative MFS siderophore iron transporter [Xylariomycetidae sp. FL2044]